MAVVQLGGLEPPTSCSTDRRSNQLSYNCILREVPKTGVANGPETRCNAPLWQAAKHPKYSRFGAVQSSFASKASHAAAVPFESPRDSEKPGLDARALLEPARLETYLSEAIDQAAG
jgi:hypothetical protein